MQNAEFNLVIDEKMDFGGLCSHTDELCAKDETLYGAW